jgi:hypothetical protein
LAKLLRKIAEDWCKFEGPKGSRVGTKNPQKASVGKAKLQGKEKTLRK